jgi:hypothetical protein
MDQDKNNGRLNRRMTTLSKKGEDDTLHKSAQSHGSKRSLVIRKKVHLV